LPEWTARRENSLSGAAREFARVAVAFYFPAIMWLVLETSTARGSLALWDEAANALLAEETFEADRAHNAALFAPLGRLLASQPGRKVEWILVGTGPGSYGGIRVGLAVGNALSLALHAPVFGWPSIAGLPGSEEAEAEFWVTGDARRGSAWLIPLRGARVMGEAVLCDSAASYEAALEGARAAGRRVLFPSLLGEFPLGVAEGLMERAGVPEAGLLARRVSGVLGEAERRELSGRPLEPVYLREPYFTVPKGR